MTSISSSAQFRSVLLATAVCLAPGLAFAQTANTGALEEVVVTSERREGSLQTTPIAVSALNTAALENRGIESIDKLSGSVPNFQILPVTASPATIQINLRGAVDSSGAVLTDDAPVGFYVDDVYRPRLAGSNFQFSDIERIEVLRGPQGTLYGRNTLAGAVRIVTRRPGNTPWFNAEVAAGNYELRSGKASVGGPLVKDMIGLSASIVASSREGYYFNRALNKTVGGADAIAGHLNMSVFGVENFEAFFSLYASEDDNEGTIEVPVRWPNVVNKRAEQATFVAGGPYVTQTPNESLGRNSQFGGSANMAYSWTGVQLRSITGFGRVKDRFKLDFSGGTSPAPGVYVSGFTRDAVADSSSFSQELQLLSRDTGSKLSWILGLYYFNEQGDQVFNDELAPGFRLLPSVFDLETTSQAAYGQATYQFTDALSITAGGRYTKDKKTGRVVIQNGFAFPFRLANLNLSDEFSAFTPRLVLDYKFSDVTFGYASVSKGFQGGGFNSLAVADPAVVAVPYGNQTVVSYEAGLKTETFGRRLRLNASAFYAIYTGLQQTAQISTTTNSFAIQNVGRATVYGVELEALASITPDLKAFANVGLMHDKYNRLTPGSSAAIARAKHIQSTPPYLVQVGFDWDRDVNFGANALKLRAGADAYLKGRRYSDVGNTLETERQSLWGGYVAVGTTDGRLELKLSAKNLTDEAYIEGSTATTPTGGVLVSPPRTYAVSLSYRY